MNDDSLELKPRGKQTPQEIVAYVKSRLYYTAPIRRIASLTWRRSELYDQHTHAIKLAYSAADSSQPTSWTREVYDPNDPMSLPRPVLNKGTGPRQNESARLGRPEYKPRVRASGENPDIKAKIGAKKGQQVLQDRLNRMLWDKWEDMITYHMPLYGGAWLVSEYDLDWTDTEKYPVLGAKACVKAKGSNVQTTANAGSCSFVLADGKVPREHFGKLGIEVEEGIDEIEPELCPMCEDHPPLMGFSPTLEEARTAKDALGRPLGQDLPKGEWKLRVPSPHNVFVRNGGIDVAPDQIMTEITEASIETLDWVAKHFPDKIRDKDGNLLVKPENPAKLMEFHAIAGAPEVYGAGRGAELFKNCVRVLRYYEEPKMEWDQDKLCYSLNQGRAVWVAGDQVLLDDDYLVKSKTNPEKMIPRVEYQYITWEFRDGGQRLDGVGLWEGIFDAQDGFNQRVGQCWAVNGRGALPFYLEDADANLNTAEADSSIPFRRIQATVNPDNKNGVPLTLLNNEVIAPGVYQEMAVYDTYIQGLETEVESGRVPPGVSAATAIAYLKNESAEKRRPRIKRIRQALKRAWQHGLLLIQANYIEPREYTYKGDSDEERDGYFRGLDLECEPVVDLEPTPDFDTEDLRREEIRDMVTMGILDPKSSPQMPRRLQKAISPMLDIYLDDNLQEEQAQREWTQFIDEDRVPVVDPSMDDHVAHHQEHGRACFAERFRDLEDKANWDGALDVLSGSWDMDLQSVLVPPPPPLPEGFPEPPPGVPPQVVEELIAQAQESGQMPPPPPPRSLQSRIKTMWEDKLLQGKFESPDPDALHKVLVWRSHDESHKLAGEAKQAASMAGQVELAAPGADATDAGTQTTEAAPPPEAPQVEADMAGAQA